MSVIDSTWRWRQLAPATPPEPRYAAAMAWDGARALLYGGRNSSIPNNPATTWELVGDEWDQLSPAASPTGLFGPQMVWDGSRFLLYGGVQTNILDATNDDLWKYESATWALLTPAHVPPHRNDSGGWTAADSTEARIAWDGSRIFNLIPTDDGRAAGDYVSQIWQYTAGDWSHVAVGSEFDAPNKGRLSPGLCWAGDRIVVAGGEWDTHQSFRDTWEYAGGAWTRTVATAGWSHRSHMALVWTGDVVYMFGGDTATVGTVGTPTTNDSWVYDKATSTWTQIFPGGSTPPARMSYSMVWDGDRVILYGGDTGGGASLGDTWVLEPPVAAAAINHRFGLG